MKIYSRPMEILESRSSNMDIKKYKKIKGIVSLVFGLFLLRKLQETTGYVKDTMAIFRFLSK